MANRALSLLLVVQLDIHAVSVCLFILGGDWGLAKSPAQSESLDKEVLERLPYWVRELLKMLEEAKSGKKSSTKK